MKELAEWLQSNHDRSCRLDCWSGRHSCSLSGNYSLTVAIGYGPNLESAITQALEVFAAREQREGEECA